MPGEIETSQKQGLKYKAYSQSRGARSMDEDPRKIAERQLYNYMDVEFRGEEFLGLEPAEHAALKHQTSLFYFGMFSWDALADLYAEGAARVSVSANGYEEPIWRGVFRHMRAAPSAQHAESLLARCLAHEGELAEFDRTKLPEELRVEWLLFDRHNGADIVPQLSTDEVAREYLPTVAYRKLALIGIGSYAVREDSADALEHYLELLRSCDEAAYEICDSQSLSRMLNVIDMRYKLLVLQCDFVGAEALLSGAWAGLVRASNSPHVHPWQIRQLEAITEKRIFCCETLHDWENMRLARENWRDWLLSANARCEAGVTIS